MEALVHRNSMILILNVVFQSAHVIWWILCLPAVIIKISLTLLRYKHVAA